MPRRLAINAAVWVLLGGSVVAASVWAYGIHNPPEVVHRRAMERAQADYVRQAEVMNEEFRASLTWSGWAEDHGLKMRVGFPREVRLGAVFEAGIEIAPIPGSLAPEASVLRSSAWYSGVRVSADQDGRTYTLKEWGYPDCRSAFSIPPHGPYDVDFTTVTGTKFRRQQYLLARNSGCAPEAARLSATLARGTGARSNAAGYDPEPLEHPWIGSITTQPVDVSVLAPTTTKQVYLAPTCMEVVHREDDHGNSGGRAISLIYRKDCAERIELDIPSGADVQTWGWYEAKDPAARSGPNSGTFIMQPEDLTMGTSARGAFEGTFKITITYALPDEPHGTWTTAWERTLPVAYDPKTARSMSAK